MSAFRKYTSKCIKFTQSVFRIQLNEPDVPLPSEFLSLIPKENIDQILSKKQNITSIVEDGGFIFNDRFTLISTVLGYFSPKNLTQKQIVYVSHIVLRSCCGILFWDLNDIDPHSLLVFVRALSLSIPSIQASSIENNSGLLAENFFALFTEKIYKLGNIDKIIQYLPSINEMMSKYPSISYYCLQMHLDTALRLCQKLHTETITFSQETISSFFKNFSRAIDASSNQNLDSTKIINELLEISKVNAPIKFLLSYLSLFLAFHFHNAKILPLLEKISAGLIEDENFHDNNNDQKEINHPLIDEVDQISIPEEFTAFFLKKRPSIPNLNQLHYDIAEPIVTAASEIAYHFIKCGLDEFMNFATILLNAPNSNIQAVLIQCIMITGPLKDGIAESFAKIDAWKIIFSSKTFNSSIKYFDMIPNTPDRLINLRQSIFDALAFLSTSKTSNSNVIYSLRKSFRNFLVANSNNSKFAGEIILMSYPQLIAMYKLPEADDNLIDILLSVIVVQQKDKINKALRFPVLSIILTIINFEECLNLVIKSQYACEALFSMMFEKPLVIEIEKIIKKIHIKVSNNKTLSPPYTNALHQMLSILIQKQFIPSLLLKTLQLIVEYPSPILLESNIDKDIYSAISLCKNEETKMRNEILEYCLKFLHNIKNYSNFIPSQVPYSKIADVCKAIGISQNLFDILYNIVIRNEIIIFPNALPMLMKAIKDTKYMDLMINTLINLCKDSINNRFSCIIGKIPSIIFNIKSKKTFELYCLISMSISNPKSIKAFFKCFDYDDDIETSLNYLSIIIENGSQIPFRPRITLFSVGAQITFPPISGSYLANGIYISSSIFIENNEPQRNFFVLKGGSNTINVSFLSSALVCNIQNSSDCFRKIIDVEYPLRRWFELSVTLKPFDGLTVCFDNKIKAGLSLPPLDIGAENYSLVFFQSFSDNSLPIQVYSLYLSANFNENELSIEDVTPPGLLKERNIYSFSAEFIDENKLINGNFNAVFSGIPIIFYCNFIRSFEVTHSINLILSLFRKADHKPEILPKLLSIVFSLIQRSNDISQQIIDRHGFAIIGYFLEKSLSTDLSMDTWRFMVNQITKIKSQPVLRCFARDIFYNFEIWKRAPIDVQFQIVSDWQRIGIFSEEFLTIPFLTNIFHSFSSLPDSLQFALNERKPFLINLQSHKSFAHHKKRPVGFSPPPSIITSMDNFMYHQKTQPISPSTTLNANQDLNGSVSAGSDIPSPSIIGESSLDSDVNSSDDDIATSINMTPTRSSRKSTQINPSLSNDKMNFKQSKNLFKSSSISSLAYQKTMESKLKSIRSMIVSLIKSVISLQKINSKDAQFLFQAIQKLNDPEQVLELLDIINYIIDINLHSYFDMKQQWMLLFLHQSEDVRIKWLGLYAKMFQSLTEDHIQSILMLMIIQSQILLNNSFSSKESLLVESLRISLGLNNTIDINSINNAPLIVHRIEYIQFAVAIAIAAPSELGDVFANTLSSICDIKENVLKIADSASILFLFIIIYWSLSRSQIDEKDDFSIDSIDLSNVLVRRSSNKVYHISSLSNIKKYDKPNRFNSIIQSHRRYSLPLKIDKVDQVSLKVLSSICAINSRHLKSALGILDSISAVTTADLSEFRGLFLNFVFSLIEKNQITNETLEFVQLLTEAVFFHFKTYDFPALNQFFSIFNESDKLRKRFDAQIPDLMTLVNVYSGDTTKLPISYFSLNMNANGTWNDKALVQSLIFFISALREDKLRPLLGMLWYFYCQIHYNSQAELAPLSPLICNFLEKKDCYSYMVVKGLLRNNEQMIAFSRSRRKSVLESYPKKQNYYLVSTPQKNISKKKEATPSHTRRRHSDVSSDLLYDFQTNLKSPFDKVPDQDIFFPTNTSLNKTQPNNTSTELQNSINNHPENITSNSEENDNFTKKGVKFSNDQNIQNTIPMKNHKKNAIPIPTITDSQEVALETFHIFFEELPHVINNYYDQPQKINEICYSTLTQFCENAPKTLPEVHHKLVDIFSELITKIPQTEYLSKSFIRLASNTNGQSFWQRLSHQIFTRTQFHFKRSSFVDATVRPILLKRNCSFDSNKMKTSDSTDIDVENRIDSADTLFEAQCERIKVNKTINGTFFLIEQNNSNDLTLNQVNSNLRNRKFIRFIPSSGKFMEIDVDSIHYVLPMFILQRQTAIEIITIQRFSVLFNFKNNNDIKSLMQLLPVQFPSREFLTNLTEQWCKRQISNFEYLTWLNALSGRTYHSPYAYPVFPWIIQDYSSKKLILDDPKIYRDLSKPIGALNPSRLDKLKNLRIDNSEEDSNFLYRSTYSCSFHVFHYLVRLEPFTSLHISMQDGKFDVAHRLFSSISNSYDRVVGTSFNFRELIPEFFFCSDFLKNVDKFALGGGINNVDLPNWANSAIDFIYKHKQALESEYVSMHINEWIDLIWGYKQNGQAAEESDNVFDPHLYPNVWQKYSSINDTEQIEELLSHVGQIPQQLFENPHPKRISQSSSQQMFNFNYNTILVSQNNPIYCSSDHQYTFHSDGKVFNLKQSISKDSIPYLSSFINTGSYAFAAIITCSNEILKFNGEKIIKTNNPFHVSKINVLSSIGNIIFSGDSDGIVSNEILSITAHKKPIEVLCGSEAFRIIISVSSDNFVVISTADELRFVRSFTVDRSFAKISLSTICEGFGIIVFVETNPNLEKSKLIAYTINGEFIKSIILKILVTHICSATSFSNDHDYLIISDNKQKVYLFDAFELELIKLLADGDSQITSLNFYRQHNYQLLIGYESGVLKYGSLNI